MNFLNLKLSSTNYYNVRVEIGITKFWSLRSAGMDRAEISLSSLQRDLKDSHR